MKKAMRHLWESDPEVALDELTWQEALRIYQGKDEIVFEPDHEWRDKRVAVVAQTLSDTFGGEFKRKPKMFWDAVKKFDSNLTDDFLKMHGIDPEDFSLHQEHNDF